MPVTETGTRARQPDASGYAVSQDGLRLYYEVFGEGEKTILFLPANPISHSRLWKAQVPYLSRHFRVVVYDGRGNGLSDHPDPAGRWLERWYTEDCLTVMDATGTSSAVLVGICSDGVWPALQLGAAHPERVDGIVAIAPGVPLLTPPLPHRARALQTYDQVLDTYEGWTKHNRHYIAAHYGEFMEFFFGEMFPEPHSTKQLQDAVAYALDGRAETFLLEYEPATESVPEIEATCRAVRCPVLVIRGDLDNCQPASRGDTVARLTGARQVVLEGSGHIPNARLPVRVNHLIREFAEESRGRRRRTARRRPAPRVLMISSPIGLGHAWRDVAIARALRDAVPGLRVEWLAQPPLTRLLADCGEFVHPASRDLAAEATHVDACSGEHRLHAFQMLRQMDEILCANFMLFDDLVRQERYDAWIADEGWEIDHFLHEQPELKTAPYVWMSDFVGYLPMPSGGEREVMLTADYNAEMIEHVERHPDVRDLSLFIGDRADVKPVSFGPGLPSIPEWTQRHFRFPGYVIPFNPDQLAPAVEPRDRRLIVASAGGSAAGLHLLRRIRDAFALLRQRRDDVEMLIVCGPRIDPTSIPPVDGLNVAGYVDQLYRTLATCDLAVVQGGLGTTMELVANRRPFIYLPLRDHFEQNHHVAYRLQRYGAPPPTDYDDATPERLAGLMAAALDQPVRYLPVESDGARRAAELIAPLVCAGR